ncbi:MAG: FabA-like domain protein [Verrucomicrobia bacterium]|nr:FabA-like domain protein [Verrucomicrobiota bacterium]
MALTEKELADLKEGLRRCGPETIEAAVRFREKGDLTAIRPVVYGLIERYQPSTARLRLKDASESTRLVDDLGLDSLTLLEIVLSIEEVLGLQIKNEELREIRTLGNLNRFLRDKITGTQGAPAAKQYSREHVALILPQQPPFLFLDSAELGDETFHAQYVIKGDEFFLSGHFKDEPIFPASVLFEAIGQAACLWVLEKVPKLLAREIKSNHVFFASLDGAHVYRKARPGQLLTIEGNLLKLRDPVAVFHGTISSNGDRVAVIDRLVLAFGEQLAPEEPAATAGAAAVPATASV